MKSKSYQFESPVSPQVSLEQSALFWFRRDLRLQDNAGLSAALTQYAQVFCVFIFDRDILGELPSPFDRRVEFIWHSVQQLDQALRACGSVLLQLHGRPQEQIPLLAQALGVGAVYANRDYEPQALARDGAVALALQAQGRNFFTCKDQVVFEAGEILSQAGRPYTVFTPYSRAWRKALTPAHLASHPNPRGHWGARAAAEYGIQRMAPSFRVVGGLQQLGFASTNLLELGIEPGFVGAQQTLARFLERMDQYHEQRNFPARSGVSWLSIHLRFGTLSIRSLVQLALERNTPGSLTWLNELIWREFYFAILFHFPYVVDRAFKRELEQVQFDNDPLLFQSWQQGKTGYPIVDAAMRQLSHSGYMHNRLRMIVASFLVKDLGIHWRWGEEHFARHLNDYDLSANNGGWQWCASTGCDAQPWFRMFNPVTQSGKFDPEGHFIRRYLPELARLPDRKIHQPWLLSPREQALSGCRVGVDYPCPVVDHAVARKLTLQRYAFAVQAYQRAHGA